MNFKDVYKAYNDDIKPDPSLLSSVLNGEKAKRKTQRIYPSFRLAMAATMVLVVSVYSYYSFSTPKSDNTAKIAMVKNSAQPKIITKSEFVPVPEQRSADFSHAKAETDIGGQTPQLAKNAKDELQIAAFEPPCNEPATVHYEEAMQPMTVRMAGSDAVACSDGEEDAIKSSGEHVSGSDVYSDNQ